MLVTDLFDVSTIRNGVSSHQLRRTDLGHDDLLGYMHKLSASFFLIIFTVLIYFVDLLYMFFLLFRSPLDMLRDLAMPTRRSPDLRVQIFYLVMCSLLPLDMLRGLALPTYGSLDLRIISSF
jgi:hypothetical protein